jgi:hypothetical protein
MACAKCQLKLDDADSAAIHLRTSDYPLGRLPRPPAAPFSGLLKQGMLAPDTAGPLGRPAKV